MEPKPRFIHGVFGFEGQGLEAPFLLGASATYAVPRDKRAQLIYLRGGNSCDALIYLTLVRDGKTMRYFPIGARAGMHVPLAVVEDLFPESKLEVFLAAPKGCSGQVVVDVGIIEVD
ncbi:MAG: molybdopterin oxidoreductase [Polyangiales bacterium]